ncbi:MAG: hypothetical protein RR202_06650 [Bacteroidales bacterium]
MKTKYWLVVATILSQLSAIYPCTSILVSGKKSKSGRPLLWKNRDTSSEENAVVYSKEGKYEFIGVVDRKDMRNQQVWMGANNQGFAIINTASYNLKEPNDTTMLADCEGLLMCKALSICKDMIDFECFLDTLSRPMHVEANFGVIDAFGNGAYFEVNNFKVRKFDVDESPDGYLIRTNYSFSGREDEGMGYVRYENARKLLNDTLQRGAEFTPELLYGYLGRTFYNSVLDKCANDVGEMPDWLTDQDYIPRHSTSSAVVFEGVKQGESPQHGVLWTVLGYPPCTVVFPVLMNYPDLLPELLKREGESNAPVNALSLSLKNEVFPIKRGNGSKYIRFDRLYNKSGEGVTQRIAREEQNVIKVTRDFLEKNNEPTREEVIRFYGEISSMVKSIMGNKK